jgi:cyclopropane fatty-acyl-phospholipid synthase-like methyltransferase
VVVGAKWDEWRAWIEYWRLPEPDVALQYDLRGATTNTWWLDTPTVNMGFWGEADPSDPDAIEAANRALFDLVAGDASIEPGNTVLDAGSGFAVNAMQIASRHGARVVGLNVSKVQTDIGLRLVHDAGLEDQIELVIGDATAIPLPSETIDRVVSVEAAFHFSTREAFFEEAYRVLRPGGRLALVDMLPLAPGNRRQRVLAKMLARALVVPESNFYGIEDYVERVKAAGFVDIRAESIFDSTYQPFRRWLRRTILRQSKGKHPLFSLPATVYLVYPMDYVRLTATRPPAEAPTVEVVIEVEESQVDRPV